MTDTRRAEFVQTLNALIHALNIGYAYGQQRQALLAMFDAATAVQGGEWVLVPREPTEAMLRAIEKEWLVGSQIDMAKREYRAMLAAAPPVQVKS